MIQFIIMLVWLTVSSAVKCCIYVVERIFLWIYTYRVHILVTLICVLLLSIIFSIIENL